MEQHQVYGVRNLAGSTDAPAFRSRGAAGTVFELSNTEGVGMPPASVYPEEYELWKAIGEGYEPTTEELSTVIRVADALSDDSLSKWTDLLGTRAHATDWKDSEEADAMAYALLSLPPHLLHPVVSTAVAKAGPWPLLTTLPPHLHSAILSAAAAPANALTLPPLHLSALDTLPTTDFPPPGLLQLQVHGITSSEASVAMQTCAAVLARALAAHPSLTSLLLTSTLPTHWLTNFTACLPPAALPSLRRLEFSVQLQPCGTAAIVRHLKRLPRLQHLCITIERNPRHDGQPSTLSTLAHAAACPAALTHLTSLEISEVQSDRHDRKTFRGGLKRSHAEDSAMLHLLPLLHAPALVSLRVSTPAAGVTLPRLCSALRHLSVLQRLSVGALLKDGYCGAAELPRTIRELESRCSGAMPPLVTGAMLGGMLGDSSQAAALTRLSFAQPPGGPKQSGVHYPRSEVARLSAAIRHLPAVLARLSALRSFSLNVLCAGLCVDYSVAVNGLAALTALTELSLQCDYFVAGEPRLAALCAARVVPALQKLQGLQRLRLCDLRVKRECWQLFDEPVRVVEACSVLRALSRLVLFCDVDRVLLAQAAQKLPALRRLWLPDTVYGCELGIEDEVAHEVEGEVAAAFPGVSVQPQFLFKCRMQADSEVDVSDGEGGDVGDVDTASDAEGVREGCNYMGEYDGYERIGSDVGGHGGLPSSTPGEIRYAAMDALNDLLHEDSDVANHYSDDSDDAVDDAVDEEEDEEEDEEDEDDEDEDDGGGDGTDNGDGDGEADMDF